MVRHTMDITKKMNDNLNLTQALLITTDQPVYALGKESSGCIQIIMLMGPLHIEIAFLNLMGDWLESSGWVDLSVKANVSTPGIQSVRDMRIKSFMHHSRF